MTSTAHSMTMPHTPPGAEDVPPLSPSSVAFPSPSSPIPISPSRAPRAWTRRRSTSDDLVVATPHSPVHFGPAVAAAGPLQKRLSAAATRSPSHSRRPSYTGLPSYPQHPLYRYPSYANEHDHIALERGGSTEGRRRTSVASVASVATAASLAAPFEFTLGEPAIPDVNEELDVEMELGADDEGVIAEQPRGSDKQPHGSDSAVSSREIDFPGPITNGSVPGVASQTEMGPQAAGITGATVAYLGSLVPAAATTATTPAPPLAPLVPSSNAAAVPYGPLTPPAAPRSGTGTGATPLPRSFTTAVRRRIDRSKALSILKQFKDSGDKDDQEGVSPPPGTPAQVPTPTSFASYATPSTTGSVIGSNAPASSGEWSGNSSSNTSGRRSGKLKSLIKRTGQRRTQSFSSNLGFGAPGNGGGSNMSQPSASTATSFASHTPSHVSPANSVAGGDYDSRASSRRGQRLTPMSSASPLRPAIPDSFLVDANQFDAGSGEGVGVDSTGTGYYATRRNLRTHSLPLPHPAFNVVLTSAGLQPVNSAELVWGTLSYRAPTRRTDYFTNRLPRELKVKVFKTLLDSYATHPGPGRWDGENAGRRELVRLSSVCKEWRSLCFDGQLWANADFTPFAPVLHPETLRQILLHARPCVRDLYLRGLDAVNGTALTVRDLDPGTLSALPATIFSSLTTLDLFGCHYLTTKDVAALLSVAPNLKSLMLKGLRIPLPPVLHAVRRHVTALEELDVSRCCGLEFLNVEEWITALDPAQKAALRVLRVGGLTAQTGGHLLGRIASDLPNLDTLDLLGCKWLTVLDFQDYVAALPPTGISPLTHLVLSGCTSLSSDALELLVDRLPHMTHFEAANLESAFYLDPPPTLARLVRSMPLLVRLDLDSTGRYGGVCDRLIEELIPGTGLGKHLQHSHLEELRIGGAKDVTAAALTRLVQAAPRLTRFEADGTEADNAVLRAFLAPGRQRTPAGMRSISLVDCHRVTHEVFTLVSAPNRTRARAGSDDYRATVFAYTPDELDAAKPVLKTFWAWRAVRPPKVWRDARAVGEAPGERGVRERQVVVKTPWWRASEDVDDMERGTCAIM